MEIQVKEILKMKQTLTQIYVNHNSKGKTYAEFYAAMERDNFMGAQEALDFGLIDEIITKRP
jgi:ATP-dependent Clp protease protease subunit